MHSPQGYGLDPGLAPTVPTILGAHSQKCSPNGAHHPKTWYPGLSRLCLPGNKTSCWDLHASCCPTPGRAVWCLTAEQELAEEEMPLRSQAVLMRSSKLAVTLCPSKGVTVQESGKELSP